MANCLVQGDATDPACHDIGQSWESTTIWLPLPYRDGRAIGVFLTPAPGPLAITLSLWPGQLEHRSSIGRVFRYREMETELMDVRAQC